MAHENNFFTPEEVDEQIEHLSQELHLPHQQQRMTLNKQIIGQLHLFYRANTPKEDARSIERAWQRITQSRSYPVSQFSGNRHIQDMSNTPRESEVRMRQAIPDFTKRKTFQQHLGMLAALAFVIILVGSMIIVLNIVRQSRGGAPGGHPLTTAAITHKPSPAVRATSAALSPNAGKIVYTMQYGYNDVYSIAWSPDSRRIATADDTNVLAWDATTGKHVTNYASQSGLAYAVAWSPDNKRLAGSDSKVYVWDANTAHLLITYPQQPQQASIALPVANTMSFSSRGNASVSYTAAFSPRSRYIPLSGGTPVLADAWSPDGQFMASAFDGYSAGYGNTVQVWNANTGHLVLTYHGHADFVEAVSWSPDGKYIASASADGIMHVWNATTGRTMLTYDGHSRGGGEVSWSPDGTRIAFIDVNNTVQIWDAATGKKLLTHHQDSKFGLSSLAWSPDSTRIASAGDNVQLWDAATGKTLYTFSKNPRPIRTIAWSPNGKYIASVTGPSEYGPGSIVLQVWIAS